jgi:hypothetical protein
VLACTETLTPHTLLTYLYRDAANYKAHGDVLLSGEATSDLHRRIRESLIDGEYFIPEKVGIGKRPGCESRHWRRCCLGSNYVGFMLGDSGSSDRGSSF